MDDFYLLPSPPANAAERNSWAVRFAFRAGRLVFRLLWGHHRPSHFEKLRLSCVEAFYIGIEGMGNADAVEYDLVERLLVEEDEGEAPFVEEEVTPPGVIMEDSMEPGER